MGFGFGVDRSGISPIKILSLTLGVVVKVRSLHSTPKGKLCGLGGLGLCGWWQGVGRDGAGVRREGGRRPPLQCARMNSKNFLKLN